MYRFDPTISSVIAEAAAPSRRRYKAALRLDEPVLIVSRRRPPTMLYTFPAADSGDPPTAPLEIWSGAWLAVTSGSASALIGPFPRLDMLARVGIAEIAYL